MSDWLRALFALLLCVGAVCFLRWLASEQRKLEFEAYLDDAIGFACSGRSDERDAA